MIDREKVFNGLRDIDMFIAGRLGHEKAKNFLRTIDETIAMLKEQEARWISVPHKRARICSHCEADEPYKFADDDAEVYEYCPHCGAKMTEGR